MGTRRLGMWWVFALMTAACSGDASVTDPAEPVVESEIIDDLWVLETIDFGGELLAADEIASRPHIEFFREGRASADDGCNHSGGEYVIEDRQLTMFSDGFWTLAGCLRPQSHQRIVSAFHGIWRSMEAVEVEGDVLEILGDVASMVLRRIPIRAWPLDGTRWVSTTVEYGFAELLFDLDAMVLTIDGQCFRTVIALEGDQTSQMTGASAVTDEICSNDGWIEPNARDEHDRLVVQLQDGFRIDLSARNPRLIPADGATLDLRRISGPSIRGNSAGPVAASDVVLQFTLDGPVRRPRIEVVQSGEWVASWSEWEWQDGVVAADSIAAMQDELVRTRLRGLRIAISRQADGGCGTSGAVFDLRFSKNARHKFQCELDAEPSDPLLAAALDIVRQIRDEL